MQPQSGLDQLSETGERIDSLLSALGTSGPMAQQRGEDLVALVTNLYGAGLERLIEVLADAGRLDAAALDALAADELVSGLLLVHGLHPYDVTTRVAAALDSVRPYLGSHGGDVELLGIDGAGVVTLRLLGTCDSCPSSTVTLQLAVEGAIQAAAPEVTAIEVEPTARSTPGLISVESLRVRLDQNEAAAAWLPIPELADLAPGEIGGFDKDGMAFVACRLGGDLFAYRDHCPACGETLVGARLERRLGDSAANLILVCPHCRARYDTRRAGLGLDGDHHLEPLPLLQRDGVLSVAVPAGV
ncbi:MAG: NifU family protein [Propionibacteriaceae bacterium]|jgi:Fe-S cluster biogenesis protein NfuA/nitrite reductase/ring-hydroxylating ferredoxin subunit